jgi:solute carrier family 25 iron transporter 28/37
MVIRNNYFFCFYKKKLLKINKVVKQRMQVQGGHIYKGIVDCTLSLIQKEGLKAFYISYPTTILMSIPFQSIHFATYEALKKTFNPIGNYDPKTHIISGGLAGAMASFFTQPLDGVKTLLQTRGVSSEESIRQISGFRQAFSTIYQRYGWTGFYRGLQPRMLTHIPATAICWTTVYF